MAKAITKNKGRSIENEINMSQDFPFPGTKGGGSLPSVAKESKDGAKALALVPQGLHPVAVFPPYQSTRKLPAITVIWLEKEMTDDQKQAILERKKGMYGLWTKQWKQMNYRRHHSRKDRLLRAIFSNKKEGMYNRLQEKIRNQRKDIICSQKRHQMKRKQILQSHTHPKRNIFTRLRNLLKPAVNFLRGESRNTKLKKKLHKCPLEREEKSPTFGFRTLVTIIDGAKCILGVNCTIDGDAIDEHNIEKSYPRSKNNNHLMKAKKIDFKPSEKIIWPKMGVEHLARTKRHIIEKEKIIASQPSCNIIPTRSKEICRNIEP